MAKYAASIALFFLLSLVIDSVESTNAANIRWWCSQTPYPKTCSHFLSHTAQGIVPKRKSDFNKMALQISMDRALHAQVGTVGLRNLCRNEREKTAWADCLELYEDAILQLNKTLANPARTQLDMQTWLSAALTDYETCRAGFLELGAASYMLPLMANNVSKLISNSLAINKLVPVEGQVPGRGRRLLSDCFPEWISAADRKFMQSPSPASQANLVVAKDGSGDFRTIKEAVAEVGKKRSGSSRFVIYVKAGIYIENVQIGSKLKNLKFVGDGIGRTVVTGSKSVGGGSTTFNSATFVVSADGFVATGMTFENNAGPENHQAVALRVSADQAVFYRCSMLGYQDTLYVHTLRQFYKECNIYGTVDFIFGNAAVVFQNCNIFVRRPMSKQKNTITAQGRTDPNQNTGIIIHSSKVVSAPDLRPVQSSFQTFLGRPWKEYSRTVFMRTFLDSLIDRAGWLEWDGDFALKTLVYREYRNWGAGSSTRNRVKWGGYGTIMDSNQALPFTVGSFITGGSWIPSTGVPFNSGL